MAKTLKRVVTFIALLSAAVVVVTLPLLVGFEEALRIVAVFSIVVLVLLCVSLLWALTGALVEED